MLTTQHTQYQNDFSYTIHSIYATQNNPQRIDNNNSRKFKKKIKEEIKFYTEETGIGSIINTIA